MSAIRNVEDADCREIDSAEAERVIRTGPVHLLDVRTPQECDASGYLPGAALLPLDLIASAPAIVPRDGAAVLVYCEHGIRSRHAARVLRQAGFSPVLSLAGGLSGWGGRRAYAVRPIAGPSTWIVEQIDQLQAGRALDVACGRGRHALLLAARGWQVHAIDRDQAKLDELHLVADRLRLAIDVERLDLEAGAIDLGCARYDLIVVTRYLYRPIVPALFEAMVPGGLLLYETFTIGQTGRGGRPANPAFLLQPGELRHLVAPLQIVGGREGHFDGQMIASVAARKPVGVESPDG